MIDTKAIRSKILDLAIRGKLTEQLSEDGTAEELLLCLRKQKKDIETSNILKGRKKKTILPLDYEDFPFPIPISWKWIRLGNVAEVFGRIGFRGYTKNDIVEQGKGAISLSPSNITIDGKCVFEKCTFISWEKYDESPEIMVNEEDVIIVKTGSSYGKCCVVKALPEKATINPQLALLKYVLCNRYYLHIVLNSSLARKQYEDFVVGAATPTFSQEDLYNFILPLPPHAEQQRIVERIEQAFSILDTIDALQTQYAGNLTVLKSKLIDAAIQGKLTEQLPEDGTAEELYQQIQAEKDELAENGELYREKTIKKISPEEIPYVIPQNWIWTRLGELSKVITKGSSPKWQGVNYTDADNGILFITSENVGSGRMLFDKRKYVQKQFNEIHPSSILQKGDILTNIVGASIGRTALFDEDTDSANTNQAVCIVRLINQDVSAYTLRYLCSNGAIQLMLGKVVDTARANLSLTSISNLLVPLPPLAEQKRIVTRLDEVLKMIEA